MTEAPSTARRADIADDPVAFDQAHVWHPYSPSPARLAPLPVASAQGVWLTLEDGRQLLDAMSSWWAVAHGHGHPRLVAAAQAQIGRMSHVMFGGLTHRPALRLAQQLLALVGAPFGKVFYADSGSVAVEVAIKMALQCQRGRGQPRRRRLLAWRGGYHGDTFAPMSVCDPDGGMHRLWRGMLAAQVFAPPPPPRGSSAAVHADYLRALEARVDDSIAAIIVEPLVQGAGGMRFHDAALVAGLRALCDRHGLLLIADEIATGFGRSGSLFATHAAGIQADILCLGKALTGGFMTLAATLTTEAVAEAIARPAGGGALMHGPTFMANPLACAVASAAVSLIEEGGWQQDVPRIEAGLRAGLAPLAAVPAVADVRVLGAIGVVEMKQPVDMAVTTAAAITEGVWLRPFGRLIYCMPPYVSSDQDIARICRAMTAAVAAEAFRSRAS